MRTTRTDYFDWSTSSSRACQSRAPEGSAGVQRSSNVPEATLQPLLRGADAVSGPFQKFSEPLKGNNVTDSDGSLRHELTFSTSSTFDPPNHSGPPSS